MPLNVIRISSQRSTYCVLVVPMVTLKGHFFPSLLPFPGVVKQQDAIIRFRIFGNGDARGGEGVTS